LSIPVVLYGGAETPAHPNVVVERLLKLLN
jgi:hypothetical protein